MIRASIAALAGRCKRSPRGRCLTRWRCCTFCIGFGLQADCLGAARIVHIGRPPATARNIERHAGPTHRQPLCITVLAWLLAASAPALGAEAVPTEQDPVAQARAVRLSGELRCLVCQNQTIADSNADLAVDLRRQVREQIAAGRSDREIIEFMTSRYGDFVLYRPPLRISTALLWAGPALLLVIGAFVLARMLRARKSAATLPLSDEDRARAERLLAGGNGTS